jgi:hypothetical protein
MKAVDEASSPEINGLMQEADGSGIQRTRLNPLVGIGRYENDRYVKAAIRQMLLQLDAAHVWQLHIQNQAPRFGHHGRLQKRLSRRERACCESERSR